MPAPALPQRYSIASLLGEGGQGRVYRVRDALRDRELALKLVSASDAEFLRREFDTLRQIRHENLIQVFDWGTLDTGEAYYTMELVEGQDWGRRMGTAQPAEEVRRILTGLLRGLAHLHCHGEIHGDLKPGNILLGQGGVVKVTDVGMGGSLEGGVAGTPGYTAPECWEGKAANVRADLYSVGVMAYEALTGKHPFGGRTIREVVAGQMEGWVPSTGAHRVKVPADLERVVMRALEREVSLRQGSADEFMEGFGVEDRVGAILGGRFVAREAELLELLPYMRNRTSESPSLVTVAGPPGSGRSSLLSELSHHTLAAGGLVVDWDDASLGSLMAMMPSAKTGSTPHDLDGAAGGLSVVADVLIEESRTQFLLVTLRPTPGMEAASRRHAVALGRYLGIVAKERGAPVNALLVFSGSVLPEALEAFERALPLMPLDKQGVARFTDSLLGSTVLEDALIEKISLVTSGDPSRVLRIVLELVRRRMIARRDGTWRFLETEQIRELRLTEVDLSFEACWAVLDGDMRSLLLALSFVSTGLTLAVLSATLGLGTNRTHTLLDELGTLGLAAERRGLWWLGYAASDLEVESSGTTEQRARIAARLLEVDHLRDSSEAFAWLTAVAAENAQSGLVSAQLAIARRDYAVAARRAEQAESWARKCGDRDTAVQAILVQAESLHQSGRHAEARRLLVRPLGEAVSIDEQAASPSRDYLLGRVCLELGDLASARSAFERVVQTSQADNPSSAELSAHANLAELDWRHGGSEARSASITRLQEVIKSTAGRAELAEQRAALTYQVGAALIEAGRREEAQVVLNEGLAILGQPYWHMRMRNALATIAYYAGEFRQSLALLDESWRAAETNGIDQFKARVLSNRATLYYGIGKFRDSVEQHRLSAMWARRMGSTFEYLVACLGESINLTLLARYEHAVERAREARSVATALPNIEKIAKACEEEAVALHCLGDDAGAEELIREANGVLDGGGFHDVEPRLDWLAARIHARRGEFTEAERLLRKAEAVLSQTTDWEDLPGVQIELDRLSWRRGDPDASLARMRGATIKAEADGAVAVAVRGSLVLVEILADHGIDDPDLQDLAGRGLALSEQAGTRETIWRISAGLGRLALRRGDRELAQQRLSLSIRVLREVAADLTNSHRSMYLATPHARSLLSALDRP